MPLDERRQRIQARVARFVSAADDQETITAAVLQASPDGAQDAFFAREEIGWHLLAELRTGRTDEAWILGAFDSLFGEMVVGRLKPYVSDAATRQELKKQVCHRVLQRHVTLDRSCGRLTGYVSEAAKNRGVDDWRERKRREKLLEALSQARVAPPPPNRERSEAFWSNVVSLLPPHQALTVLLLEYLDWRPREVVAKWSHTRLDHIASWVERRCRSIEKQAGDDAVERCFEMLRQRLRQPISQTSDKGEKGGYGDEWDHPAGSLVLAAYFETDPANNLSQWNSRAKSRIRVAKLREYPHLFADAEG